jgi:hypothetical protein
MVKWIVVKLSDREHQILETIDEIPGDCSQKLKELYIQYLQTAPKFKADFHIIKLEEKKDLLLEVLTSIWKEYETSISPMEDWDKEKFNRVRDELVQVNAIQQMGVGNYIPTQAFKKPWLSAFHKTSTIFPDIDEFSQAGITSAYVLTHLSRDTFPIDLLKDAAIVLNEDFMFVYAIAKKRANDFSQAIKKRKSSTSSGNDLTA